MPAHNIVYTPCGLQNNWEVRHSQESAVIEENAEVTKPARCIH